MYEGPGPDHLPPDRNKRAYQRFFLALALAIVLLVGCLGLLLLVMMLPGGH
jgi:hypothetical protein